MGTIYKTSRAEVRDASANARYVYALDSENPEIVLASTLRDFLQTIGYSNLFPNFDNIRIGTVHPFAIQQSLAAKKSCDEILGDSR